MEMKHRTICCLFTGLLLLPAGCGRDEGHAAVFGSIEAEEAVVAFGVAGTVDRVLVDEGSSIDSAQVLAVLDTFDLATEVEMRQAGLDAATASLSDLEGGYRTQEISQASALLQQARATADQASADLERQTALFEQGAVSERDYSAAVTARQVAEAQASQALSRLSLLASGYPEGQVGSGAARVREAAAALALAQSRLGQASLESPLAGVVIERYVGPGEYVGPSSPVFGLADLDTVQLKAWIEEPLLGRVAVGTRAEISSDSWPETSFPGTVTWISQEAEFTPTQVQTEDERTTLVFEVSIEVPNPDGRLLPGMPVSAVLELRPR
jgi:HlyD family secretion protein